MRRREPLNGPVQRDLLSRVVRRPAANTLRSRRRGIETLELILALPVIFIATVALFQFGFLVLIQQAMETAAVEGAREAAKGGTVTEVAQVVQTFLSPHNVVISNTPGAGTLVVLEDGNGPVTTEEGDTTLACTPQGPALNTNEVRVTVCISFTAAGVPDWLSSFGFSFAGRSFEISSILIKEF